MGTFWAAKHDREEAARHKEGVERRTKEKEQKRRRAQKREGNKEAKQGEKGNGDDSGVNSFDTREEHKKQEAGHRETSKESTKEEERGLSDRLQQQARLDPRPPHLKGTYRITSDRTAKQIEKENSWGEAKLAHCMLQQQAKAQGKEENQHRVDIRPKLVHKQQTKNQQTVMGLSAEFRRLL